ncbi:MAG TPA: hypothetical protein PLM27_10870 [Chitinophagales bacterium]|nr:hypothetical protein [Chitinophagales bacterium]
MHLHSKFKFRIAMPIAMTLFVLVLLGFIIGSFIDGSITPSIGIFAFMLFFIFLLIWIVFGELRTKVIRVELKDDAVMVSSYFGLGKKRMYNLTQFEGFETAILPSNYDKYEYLYLMTNGKKVVKLSQFYHKNYNELKTVIEGTVTNLGEKSFSMIEEFKEIFQ